jgi:two-component system chemotaxis sensor kinase CheA
VVTPNHGTINEHTRTTIYHSPFTLYYPPVDQTQRELLVELEQLVELIFADLDDLRISLTNGREPREGRDLVDRIFRRVHTLKGSALSSEVEGVSQIAHEFENLLDALRSGQTVLSDPVLDICISATEALEESLSQAASGTPGPPRSLLFERIREVARGSVREAGTDAEAILSTLPSEIWQSLTQAEQHRLVSVVEERTPLFLVGTSFDLSNFDEEFFRLKEKLAETGEVISTSPTVDDSHPGKINFRILYGSKTALDTLRANVIEFFEVAFDEVKSAGNATFQDYDQGYRPASVSSLANFVRTDLDKLDQLISSTHVLLRTTSNALGFALSQAEITQSAKAELDQFDREIKRSFMGVEDELIKLRMIPSNPMLQRAVRGGRAAARLAGKEVDFEIVGGDIELDKLMVDAIADPLIHLLRNAVDHGIEDAETRIQSGKSRRGAVRIEALSEGSQSRVRVTDDGRGIDPQLISEAAARLGIAENDSGLDFDRSLRLIFRPGFTTLETVSDVSGRGVGLDVVETAVEQVGGELRVSSKPGVGTTFEIRLSVTFGLLEATVFLSGGNRYCIPTSQVVVTEAADASEDSHEPATPDGVRTEAPDSRSDEWRAVSIRELLGHPPQDAAANTDSDIDLQLITCQFSDERVGDDGKATRSIGVLVDKVEGTEEVLVRTLGRHAGRWYGVAGATELRDGTVALVLDLPRLLRGSE